MPALHNKVNRAEMRQRLMEEKFQRVTLSFYRYVRIADPAEMRNRLWQEWNELQVFGRVYLAHEGINAQISVPQQSFDEFRKSLDGHPEFKDVPFKIAVEDDGKSFYILTVKVRRQIVADGIPEGAFDVTNVGHHLDAIGFNEAMEDPDAVVVDMRNHY
ncbi:MAG TPA: hypothetical protein VI731_01875, partial [Bacteroidia bacterium]|nr:hypothetical protein [Bacteroidia bacterium]